MNHTNGYADSPLIALRDPRSPAAEAYRTLRTNIQFSSLDKPLHTLLATSTAPDEGKSTTLANLAVTIAQAEQRVILVTAICADFAPHPVWAIERHPGDI